MINFLQEWLQELFLYSHMSHGYNLLPKRLDLLRNRLSLFVDRLGMRWVIAKIISSNGDSLSIHKI